MHNRQRELNVSFSSEASLLAIPEESADTLDVLMISNATNIALTIMSRQYLDTCSPNQE